jgi:hypothetical protein
LPSRKTQGPASLSSHTTCVSGNEEAGLGETSSPATAEEPAHQQDDGSREDEGCGGYSVRRAAAVLEPAAQDAGASAPASAMASPARASAAISGGANTDMTFGG